MGAPENATLKRFAALIPLMLLAACQTGGDVNDDDVVREQPAIVLEREKVSQFRGTEMPDLLERLDSDDPDQWSYVRRHVHPAPLPPVTPAGRVNYAWPPADWARPNARQRAWRSYLLWPEHIRTLLHQQGWDEAANRTRLARFGRMYRIVHRFQNAPEYSSGVRESEHWRQFAESMLAYGDDGRSLLISNMILALTSPTESVVFQAQNVLSQVGHAAVEPLCAALWTGHNQLVEAQDASGETIYVVQTNANFPKYVVEALQRIGPRTVTQAIYELENGPTGGTAWRFRKNFVDLLGRFRDPEAVRALEAEIDRVKIRELDREELAQGREVIDQLATDHASFVYREYLLSALGNVGAVEGLRAVIRIWKLDVDHETAAIDAIYRISGQRVRSILEAEELARRLQVELKDD